MSDAIIQKEFDDAIHERELAAKLAKYLYEGDAPYPNDQYGWGYLSADIKRYWAQQAELTIAFMRNHDAVRNAPHVKWIKERGHKPNCPALKCGAEDGLCLQYEPAAIHSGHRAMYWHSFKPQTCTCGYAELTKE